jgi:hypothetical protein
MAKRRINLVEKIPGFFCVCGSDPLEGIADMNENMIAHRDLLVSEQSQTDIAPDASGLAAGHMTLHADDPHWNGKTHARLLVDASYRQEG